MEQSLGQARWSHPSWTGTFEEIWEKLSFKTTLKSLWESWQGRSQSLGETAGRSPARAQLLALGNGLTFFPSLASKSLSVWNNCGPISEQGEATLPAADLLSGLPPSILGTHSGLKTLTLLRARERTLLAVPGPVKGQLALKHSTLGAWASALSRASWPETGPGLCLGFGTRRACLNVGSGALQSVPWSLVPVCQAPH